MTKQQRVQLVETIDQLNEIVRTVTLLSEELKNDKQASLASAAEISITQAIGHLEEIG